MAGAWNCQKHYFTADPQIDSKNRVTVDLEIVNEYRVTADICNLERLWIHDTIIKSIEKYRVLANPLNCQKRYVIVDP
jgi:hypothetical protein